MPQQKSTICLPQKKPVGRQPICSEQRIWQIDPLLREAYRILVPYRATAYAMQHTFINESIPNGASETAVAEVGGYEDKAMILRFYSHTNLQRFGDEPVLCFPIANGPCG